MVQHKLQESNQNLQTRKQPKLNSIQKSKAKSCKIIKKSKLKSWRDFIFQINTDSKPPKHMGYGQ